MENKNSQHQGYNIQQMLPHDLSAEKNILGTIFNHEEYFQKVEDMLTSKAFYHKPHQDMFRLMKYILQQGQIIDEGSVMECAEKFKEKINGSVDDLLVMEIASYDNERTFFQDVARIVDYGQRRTAWEIMQRMSQMVLTLADDAEETLTNAIRQIEDIRGSVNGDSGIITAKDAVKLVYDQINDNIAGINKSSFKTGYRIFDSKGGVRLGSVNVIGAWTSVGKSSLAMNITINMAKSGVPGAYYSLEMGAVELWSRIIGSETNISAGKILGYPLKREEIERIDGLTDGLSTLPVYIDDKATTTFPKMLRSVRAMVKKYGIKFFVVDYLQIFAQNSNSDREEANIGRMARECKNICRELNIICFLLSQLRRDKNERHPAIDMLRGSGQIEESADGIILIDRPEAHPEWGVTSFLNSKLDIHGRAELRGCKGRNVGQGAYIVGFDAVRTQFYEEDGYKIGDEIEYDDGRWSTMPEANQETEQVEIKDEKPFEPPTETNLPF